MARAWVLRPRPPPGVGLKPVLPAPDRDEGFEAEDGGRGVDDIAEGVLVDLGLRTDVWLDAADVGVVLGQACVAVVALDAEEGLDDVADGDEGAEGVGGGVADRLAEVRRAGGGDLAGYVCVEDANAADGEVDAGEVLVERGERLLSSGSDSGEREGGERRRKEKLYESRRDGSGRVR